MKVKILKHVLQWVPGQEVDVDDKTGAELCKKTLVDMGGVLLEVRKAMPLDEAEALKSVKVDMSKVTQHDLMEMGKKNVVPTPYDPAFDKRLARLAKPVADDDEAKAAPKKKAK